MMSQVDEGLLKGLGRKAPVNASTHHFSSSVQGRGDVAVSIPSCSVTYAEGADDADASTERPESSEGEGARRSRNMGRYPFRTWSLKYLEWRRKKIKGNTFTVEQRNLAYLRDIFEQLREEEKVSTTNPSYLTEDDIDTYRKWTTEQGWQGSTFERYRYSLEGICVFAGNTVFARMEAQGYEFPTRVKKAVKSLTEAEIARVMEKAADIPGWYGELARFIAAMYAYTGLRPSELRLARLEDLDQINWQIFVRHPKGEGKYGEQRLAPVTVPARAAVLRYIRMREERLREFGLEEAEPLLPSLRQGGVNYYSEVRLRDICARINRKLKDDPSTRGISFSLKTLRASYCQMVIDRDPSKLSQVSATMGHNTTRTTEEFYGRIRRGSAVRDINDLFEKGPTPTPPAPTTEERRDRFQSERIGGKYEMTGYQ